MAADHLTAEAPTRLTEQQLGAIAVIRLSTV
jgi:hypothetical protein